MRNLFRYFLCVALGVSVALTLGSCTDDGTHLIEEEVISKDEQWSGSVHVDKTVKVQNGVTLTIDAGTRVTFGSEGSLVVGSDGAATIVISGTPSKPVQFSGGMGIHILNAARNSSIAYCSISNASSAEGFALAIKSLRFPMKNIDVSGGGGVEVKDPLYGGVISGMRISVLMGAALSVPADYSEFIDGLTVEGGYIHLLEGGNRLKVQLEGNSPYLITGRISLEGTVVIKHAQVYCTSDAVIEIGNRTVPTTAMITNSSFALNDGIDKKWKGIVFGSQVNSQSRMEGCAVSGAEVGVSLFSTNRFTVAKCHFTDNNVAVLIQTGTAWDNNTIVYDNAIDGNATGIQYASPKRQDNYLGRRMP